MEQRVSLVTLGVSDLGRARAFYEGLGWTTGAAPADDVVFFQAGGTILALWGRAQLAEDSVVADGGGWGGVTLAYNTRSPAEVDAVLEEARAAGGTVLAGRGRDLLGRLLRCVRRPRRASVGGRPQPALDAPRRRLGPAELTIQCPRRARRDQPQQEAEPAAKTLRRLAPRCDAARPHRRKPTGGKRIRRPGWPFVPRAKERSSHLYPLLRPASTYSAALDGAVVKLRDASTVCNRVFRARCDLPGRAAGRVAAACASSS